MLIICIKIGTILLNILYAFLKLLPVQDKVVMISRQSNEPGVDFLLLEQELKKRHPAFKVKLMCHTLDGGLKSSKLTKLGYCFHMLSQMYQIATAKVVILDTYCIVVSLLKHRSSLTVIQIWHAMGAMKKCGYAVVDTPEGTRRDIADAMRMHQNYDYVFASADAVKPYLAEGFHCDPEKILTMPLPRLDRLVNDPEYEKKIKEKIDRAYPELRKKPVILYSPTFRKDEEAFSAAAEKLIAAVDKDTYNLVVKLHPLSKTQIPDGVYTAPEFSSTDMIFAADYMISDYSCIIYEAAVRKIPLFFYDFDLDFYHVGRGLCIDYPRELPGPASPEADSLVAAIEDDFKNKNYDREALQSFAEHYVHPTSHATADAVDFVEQFL